MSRYISIAGDVAEAVRSRLGQGAERVVVVAGEGIGGGYEPGRQNVSARYCEQILSTTGIRPRITIMGYYTRGSRAVAADIELGLRLGSTAVHRLMSGDSGHLVGVAGERELWTPLRDVAGRSRPLRSDLLRIAADSGLLVDPAAPRTTTFMERTEYR